MAFPTTISNLSLPSDSAGKAGPFVAQDTGAVYIIGEDTGTGDLEIWKAADPTSSFSFAATLLAAGAESFPMWGSWSCVQDANLIHVIAQENGSTTNDYRVHYLAFDTVSDSLEYQAQVIYTPTAAPAMASVDIGMNTANRRLLLVFNGESGQIWYTHTVPTVSRQTVTDDFVTPARFDTNGGVNPGVSVWDLDISANGSLFEFLVCYSQGGTVAGRLAEWQPAVSTNPTLRTERVFDDPGQCDGINCGLTLNIVRTANEREYHLFEGWDDANEEKRVYWVQVDFASFGSDFGDNMEWYKLTSTLAAGQKERMCVMAPDIFEIDEPVYAAASVAAGDELRNDDGENLLGGIANNLVATGWTASDHVDTGGAQGSIFLRGDNLVYAWLTDDNSNNDLVYSEYVIRSVPDMPIIEIQAGTGNASGAEVINFTETLLEGDLVLVTQYKDIGSWSQPTGYTIMFGPESNTPNTICSYKFMGSTPDTSFTIPSGFGTVYAWAYVIVRNVNQNPVLDRGGVTRGSGSDFVSNASDQDARGDWPLLIFGAGMDEDGTAGVLFYPYNFWNGVASATGGNPNGARASLSTKRTGYRGTKLMHTDWQIWDGVTANDNRHFVISLRNDSFVGTFPTTVPTFLPTRTRNFGPFIGADGFSYAIGNNSSNVQALRSNEPNVYFDLEDETFLFNPAGIVAKKIDGIDTIYIAQINTTGGINYIEYNMTTRAFTNSHSISAPPGLPATLEIDMDIRSNGDVVVVYTGDSTVATELMLATKDSGVWTNDVVVFAGASGDDALEPAVVVGAGDQAHISFYVASDAANEVRFRSLSSGNVLRTLRTKTTNTMSRTRTGSTFVDRNGGQIVFGVEEQGEHKQHTFQDFDDDTDPTITVYGVDTEAVNNPLNTSALVTDKGATGKPQYQVVNGASGPGALKLALKSDKDANFGSFSEIVADILNEVPSQSISGLTASIITRGSEVLLVYMYEDNGQQYGEYLLRLIGELFQADNVALTTGGITMGGAGSALPIEKMLPDGDDFIGSWTNELLSTTDIYLSIDEDSPKDDNDYARSSTNPTADRYKVSLSNLVGDFRVAQPHRVKYGYRKNGLPTIDCTVRLIEGASTVIASWQHLDVDTVVVEANQLLTQEQVNSITNYDNLFLEFEADIP